MREITVVIPTRDTEELTLRCVRSVRAAGASIRDIVVVDDGGTDGTAAAIARLDPSIVVLRNAISEGFTRAANRGAAARTEIDLLLFLNSDTELAPEALPSLIRAFDADSRLGVAGALLHYPDGAPQWSAGPVPSLAWFFAMASGAGAFRHRLPGYRRTRLAEVSNAAVSVGWVSGAAMAVRGTVWAALGPFDERFFFYAQDLDLCVRARSAGWTVALVPAARVLHHHGATIGQGGRAPRQDPRLLWRDLLRWAEKARGPRFAARAARTLRFGARSRLFARALGAPFLSASRRAAVAEDSLGYRRALAEPPSR